MNHVSDAKWCSDGPARDRLSLTATSPAWPLVAFVFCVCAVVLPILAQPYLPLVDLPNHIARLYIAAAPADSVLFDFYTYGDPWMTNSAADLIWMFLGRSGDPARFAQVLMAAYAFNYIAATMVLARVVQGHWTVWSALAGLFVYSAPFFWGFQNFTLSLILALYGLALWLALEGTRWRRWRPALFLPLAVVIYLMHIFGLLILGIAVFGREVQRALEDRSRPALARLAEVGLNVTPYSLPVFYLAWLLISGPTDPGSNQTAFGGVFARFWALVSPVAASERLGLATINPLSYLAALILVVCVLRGAAGRGARLVFAPRLKGAATALIVAALLAPEWLNGVWGVHIRVPVFLVAVLVAGTAWRGLSPRTGALLCLAFGGLILARGIEFDRMADRYGNEVADLTQVTEALPAGSRVLSVRAPGYQPEARYYHFANHLVRLRDVFSPTLFQGTHTLYVKDRWAHQVEPVQSAIDIRWLSRWVQAEYETEKIPVIAQNWHTKFTHVLLLDPVELVQAHWVDLRLGPVARQDRFSLYEINPGLLPPAPLLLP